MPNSLVLPPVTNADHRSLLSKIAPTSAGPQVSALVAAPVAGGGLVVVFVRRRRRRRSKSSLA